MTYEPMAYNGMPVERRMSSHHYCFNGHFTTNVGPTGDNREIIRLPDGTLVDLCYNCDGDKYESIKEQLRLTCRLLEENQEWYFGVPGMYVVTAFEMMGIIGNPDLCTSHRERLLEELAKDIKTRNVPNCICTACHSARSK